MTSWGPVIVIFVAWAVSYFCYRCGRAEGKEEGYRVGRTEADNWWLHAEQQVDRTRQTIWREHV